MRTWVWVCAWERDSKCSVNIKPRQIRREEINRWASEKRSTGRNLREAKSHNAVFEGPQVQPTKYNLKTHEKPTNILSQPHTHTEIEDVRQKKLYGMKGTRGLTQMNWKRNGFLTQKRVQKCIIMTIIIIIIIPQWRCTRNCFTGSDAFEGCVSRVHDLYKSMFFCGWSGQEALVDDANYAAFL